MLNYTLQRLVYMILVLIALSLVSFTLIQIPPGGLSLNLYRRIACRRDRRE